MDFESKYLGGMIGSALGDCIGQLAFFHSNKESILRTINHLSTLIYTDDTAMAIGLSESILKNQGKIDSQQLGKTFHENNKKEKKGRLCSLSFDKYYNEQKENSNY